MRRSVFAVYLRNLVFGVEDGLVSTAGLLSGIAFAGVERRTIFLVGMVLIAVEAFSMAVGSFLSEHSAEDYLEQSEVPLRRALGGSVVMFFSYLLSGFIPLWPYLILPVAVAFGVSVAGSLFALFALGVVGARFAHVGVLKNSLRMVIIGGVAITLGIGVGQLITNYALLGA
ncbi:VIT1/CCC1 transporter family protein [Candidatus Parcubacteria bacterium]|nr:VIT1/CCC1 transporter family protein [Candidatus Parcubacteria bacterium]